MEVAQLFLPVRAADLLRQRLFVANKPWRSRRPNGSERLLGIFQKERGSPSTCSATYESIKFVETGATW